MCRYMLTIFEYLEWCQCLVPSRYGDLSNILEVKNRLKCPRVISEPELPRRCQDMPRYAKISMGFQWIYQWYLLIFHISWGFNGFQIACVRRNAVLYLPGECLWHFSSGANPSLGSCIGSSMSTRTDTSP